MRKPTQTSLLGVWAWVFYGMALGLVTHIGETITIKSFLFVFGVWALCIFGVFCQWKSIDLL